MAESVVSSILNWLRAGYPEGVPPKDYFPLLALLNRTLDGAELREVLQSLQADGQLVSSGDIREAIVKVTEEPPNEADVRHVAAHLAQVGWPLSGGARKLAAEHEREVEGEGSAHGDVGERAEPGFAERVIAWLRSGYPDGVPQADYIPLLALLRRRLSDEEVHAVAAALAERADESGTVDATDAQVLMSRVLDALPSEADLDRVQARLGELGATLR